MVKIGQQYKNENGDFNGGVCVFVCFYDEDFL